MPERAPRVSVVIPTYNRANLLVRSLRSVLDQTYTDLEAVIVDDGSTDGTREVVEGFADARIRYIRSDRNQGVANTRNLGIEHSRGEFVAFQDSDDAWMPGKLEKQMAAFSTAGADTGVVYCGFWREHYGARSYIPDLAIPVREGDVHRQLLAGNFVSTQTVVARRSELDRVGPFDAALPPLEDWDMALRLSANCRFALVDEPLVQSQMNEDSISAAVEGYIRGYSGIVAKYEGELNRDPPLLARHCGTIGHCLCASGRMREGRAWYLRAARLNPAHLPHAVGVLLSMLGRRMYVAAARAHHRLAGRRKTVPFLYDPVRRSGP